jgi:hypothetical protein
MYLLSVICYMERRGEERKKEKEREREKERKKGTGNRRKGNRTQL